MGERWAAGRAAREVVPLRELAFVPAGRDALTTVLDQNKARVPDLVPLRMQRMSASPWTYYRGAAAVMAADLAAAPHTGIEVQLCGDAHVLNFGLWATPERQLSFDLRDFDETVRGPFEWDVKRFLASLIVLSPAKGPAAVRAALRAYREKIAFYSTADELRIWYDVITADQLLSLFAPEDASARVARKARRRTSAGAARKLTHMLDGRLRIVEDPPIRVRADFPDEAFQAYHDSLPYERRGLLDRFTLVDAVRQVVGVGSVGMRVHLVLLQGRNGQEPLFLQMKQAGPSVYEQFLGPSPYAGHGERVIRGKRQIQAASDIFLGWAGDYYVRQFRDMKVIPNGELITPFLVPFAERCAHVLARAHARTGDALAIAGYIGKGRRFDEAMAQYAAAYAEQTTRDHAELVASE
ncbi:Uncharacterized conserved protein, DUF2252 family [Paractinoplanes atraurantiacus]|uniref:Uncharacterized conserved protein, DUF2252 family n=2 Tax=Paractinoplanes atraurantiacus TaxID=1036182 RepID=A0A285KLG3_9ACTN|nr:Uncharacterized conserved protein, DUF2252 family [Actinoplanes atraurantiacus]